MRGAIQLELWFTERQTSDLAISCRIKNTIYQERTKYQDLAVVDTYQFGRMLLLDGVIMTTERDEFFYHEMIAHVVMHTHPHPEQILVVGGGDGGSVREVLKHPSVKRVVLAEIDEGVIAASKKYLPSIAKGLEDSRVELEITDGTIYVREHRNEFDVIIIDSTDPIGPGVGLFTKEFYQDVFASLKDKGVMVAQTESPVLDRALIPNLWRCLKNTFPLVRLFLGTVPTYMGGPWSWTLASKGPDPLAVPPERFIPLQTRYYTPEIHKTAFVLPPYVLELLAEE